MAPLSQFLFLYCRVSSIISSTHLTLTIRMYCVSIYLTTNHVSPLYFSCNHFIIKSSTALVCQNRIKKLNYKGLFVSIVSAPFVPLGGATPTCLQRLIETILHQCTLGTIPTLDPVHELPTTILLSAI